MVTKSYYWLILGTIGNYWVQLSTVGYFWVLFGTIGYYWELSVTIGLVRGMLGLLHGACHGWAERWVGVQRGGHVARLGGCYSQWTG